MGQCCINGNDGLRVGNEILLNHVWNKLINEMKKHKPDVYLHVSQGSAYYVTSESTLTI